MHEARESSVTLSTAFKLVLKVTFSPMSKVSIFQLVSPLSNIKRSDKAKVTFTFLASTSPLFVTLIFTFTLSPGYKSPPFKSISFILESENEGYNFSIPLSPVLALTEQHMRSKETLTTQTTTTNILINFLSFFEYFLPCLILPITFINYPIFSIQLKILFFSAFYHYKLKLY